MRLSNQDEALQYLDTAVRAKWVRDLTAGGYPALLGKAVILSEKKLESHTVWSYEIEGLPATLDARTRWLLDTSETVDTTLNEDERTIEAAYQKAFGKRLT